jgi:hypothetical protein
MDTGQSQRTEKTGIFYPSVFREIPSGGARRDAVVFCFQINEKVLYTLPIRSTKNPPSLISVGCSESGGAGIFNP